MHLKSLIHLRLKKTVTIMKNAYFSPVRSCRPALHTPERSHWSGLVPCHVAYTWKKQRVRAGPGTPPSGEAELKGPHAGRAALGGLPQGERPPAAVVCQCWCWCWCCCAPPRAAPSTCRCRLAEGSSFTSVTNRHGSLRCTAPRRRIAPPRRAAPRRAAPTAAAGPAAGRQVRPRSPPAPPLPPCGGSREM